MRTILVTGANSGVGFATTRALVQAGHTVVMAVRDPQRGHDARSQLVAETPAAKLRILQIDLLDLDSVRAAANACGDIDVLINNAAIAFQPLALSPQNIHAPMAANHVGHFFLTALLRERLARHPDGRVVIVTSTLAKKGRLDLSNLDGSGFDATRAYTQSKLANVLFAAELDRRLRAQGATTKSVLVHPGVPVTPMQQKARGFIGVIVRTAVKLIGNTAEHGAAAVVHAAIGNDVDSGELWEPGKRPTDAPRRAAAWPTMAPSDDATRLWQRTEAIVAAPPHRG